MDPLPAAVLQIIFAVFAALCTGAEAALCCVNDYKMKESAKDGNKKAIRVMRLMSRETKVVSAMQAGIIAFIAAASFMGASYIAPLVKVCPLFWAMILIAVCEIAVFVVFCDMVPKKICTSKPDECAMALSSFITVCSAVLSPIATALNALAKLFVSLSGNDPNGEAENVTEDEIRMMVDLGSEKGTIAPEEKELITNIFEFGDLDAGDVMTHRKDVTVLMSDETIEEWEKSVRESGYSRFPVCGEDIDDIVGVVYARELYEFLYDKGTDRSAIIHTAYVVPETVSTETLFSNMQKEKTHFAVVADEYGGFSGIVTMDDILSEIVGDIEDEEYDEEDEDEQGDIIQVGENEWDVDGLVPLDELSEVVGLELPTDEFDTLSGLVLSSIDYVPDDGATLDVAACGLEIKVTQIKDRRIERAVVKKTD